MVQTSPSKIHCDRAVRGAASPCCHYEDVILLKLFNLNGIIIPVQQFSIIHKMMYNKCDKSWSDFFIEVSLKVYGWRLMNLNKCLAKLHK